MKFVIALLLFTFLSEQGATFESPDENKLIKVSQSRYWRLLLQMRPGWIREVKSTVAAGDFFLSPQGRYNPLAELKEDILAFSQADRKVGFFQQHPQCAFPERFRYLKEVLNLNIEKVVCPEFEEWMQGLAPESATLVYSAGFENNPASVFGHTLLRINSKPKEDGSKRDLLDYGVSYAANSPPEMDLEFAIRGLFGGYYGVFEILPYYMKVNLYSHSENRDLWEYDLNLSTEQVRHMLGHLWELRSSAIYNYYFIDENCAYMILHLLDVANENWHFIDKVPWYVIPSDTVKIVALEPGATKAVRFRPSIYKKLASQYNHLDTDQKRIDFFSLIEMSKDPSEVKDIEPIDTALTNFQYLKYKIGSELNTEQNQYFKNLLVRRSQFLVEQNKTPLEWGQEDANSRPDLSHGSFQVGGNLGTVQNKFAQEVHFRMGLHDLMNNDMGLPRNSIFEWLQFKMLNVDNAGFTLDQIDILNIKSIFSRNRLQKLYSWKANFQYRTPKDMDCGSCKTGYVAAAGGFGTDLTKNLTTYILLGLALDSGNPFPEGYRLGTTAELGAVLAMSENWKMGLGLQTTYDTTNQDGRQNFHEILFEQGYTLSTRWDLRAKIYHIPETNHGRSYNEGLLGINYYFN